MGGTEPKSEKKTTDEAKRATSRLENKRENKILSKRWPKQRTSMSSSAQRHFGTRGPLRSESSSKTGCWLKPRKPKMSSINSCLPPSKSRWSRWRREPPLIFSCRLLKHLRSCCHRVSAPCLQSSQRRSARSSERPLTPPTMSRSLSSKKATRQDIGYLLT